MFTLLFNYNGNIEITDLPLKNARSAKKVRKTTVKKSLIYVRKLIPKSRVKMLEEDQGTLIKTFQQDGPKTRFFKFTTVLL